jgi:hypothetical protein
MQLRQVVVWLALAALLGVLTVPAAALELRSGRSPHIAQADVIDDDLYVAGGTVSVAGRVRGDLVAVGGTVVARGEVDGDILGAGGTIEVLGPVRATIRVVGGNLTVGSAIGGDVVAVGGNVAILPEARIGRDVAVTAGMVSLNGTVTRNVHIAGGRVEITGTIGGNLVVRGGEIVMGPTAVVRGNFTYSSEVPLRMASGARVVGTVTQEPYPVRPLPSRRALTGFRIAFGVADFFWMLLISLFALAVVPRGVEAPADALRARPLAALGWGALLLLGIPLVAVALFVMVVGIPISTLLVLAHVLALFVSHAAAALAIGRAVRLGTQSPYAHAAIGVALIAVATNLPFVGIFLRLLIVAFGLGAAALALWASRRGTPGVPAGPGPTGPARAERPAAA